MAEKYSATIENYLVNLLILERDGEPASGVRLAEVLGVTPPTVTNTLKRMLRDGLVTMDAAHQVHLSEPGREAAGSVMRKHMLAEWMLHRMVPWSRLHREAHELEHAISGEVEAALLAEHGHPQVCPHGNPLPGHEQAAAGWVPLTQLGVGGRGVIRRVHEFAENDPAVLAFLEEKHIEPGQEAEVLEVLPFNQTLTLRVGGQPVSLGFAVARCIFLELAE